MTVGRLLAWTFGVALSLLLLVGIADYWLLPALVHQQTEVLVPDLGGRTLDEARSELERLGLSMLSGEEVHDEKIPPGTVLGQNPPPLRSVRRGRPVTVMVSAGEPTVRTPDLVGLSQRQAELALGRLGLRIGRVARTFDPSGSLGIVAQRPHAGTEVRPASSVAVLVREGHERAWHRMPDLIGRPVTRAREELARAGFEVRGVTYRPARDQVPGTVLDQWPPAGSRIPSGGSIELVAASRG